MPKLPRDLSGRSLIKLLKKYGYEISRETGSHIRIISTIKAQEHKITIPDHGEIKLGTLNNILNDIAFYLGMTKSQLIDSLFT